MNRSKLSIAAVAIAAVMALVWVADLDGLPRGLRTQMAGERKELAAAQTNFQSAQDAVLGDLQTNSDLFHGIASSQQWPDQLSHSLGDLQYASHQVDQLDQLRKADHHTDLQKAEALLSDERNRRTQALQSALSIQKDAAHWIDLKEHLPQAVAAMDRDHQAIANFDLSSLIATIHRTETDWPDKKADLETRLESLETEATDANAAWDRSAEARRAAASGDAAHVDYAALFGPADQLHQAASDLPSKSAEIKSLSAQLYDSWDKILVDMEERGHFSGKTYDQKIRTITTRYADASASNGATTADEKWVEVAQPVYVADKNDLGMAIEHKSAGKYDTEAEHVVEPAGFAYVAPPSVGRNQYGYWDHRDGRDFWVFYGQYALMRDLLFNHDYRPFDRYDWEGYRDYRSSGRTYYGRGGDGGTRWGTNGADTATRYSGSTFAKSGGFKDSKYASKSGSYRDSRFSSPNAANPNADHSPHRFGSGSGSSAPRSAPRPSSRPSFRPPSGARHFGKH